jgi:small subunit ribosomal protein S4
MARGRQSAVVSRIYHRVQYKKKDGFDVARYTDAVCRLCRRENMKLFRKGERCLSDKCAINKRNYAPGQHGQRRAKLSEYGLQLREKQKVKRMYGVLESQFRRYFQKAARSKEVTGSELLVLLERRLDNVVYLMGFADSRAQARQLVQHGHIRVNGRRVNIPSFLIKQGDVVEPREKSRDLETVRSAIERLNQKQIPVWIHVDSENMRGVVQALPKRHDLTMPFHEQLIVELYSK